MPAISIGRNQIQRISALLRPLFIIGIAVISIFLVYLIGLESMPAVHDTFHDLRHSAGFPCH
ncbi:putative cobalt transporter subunit CbtB [Leptospira fainei serovar Hurstbridge str. BUT 6]|uniref:Cobalt transporter subunit CbtB n=1 Tax=Leptospira fainei serovar Hurstbridge str. BUT 6 TaxID=1193011 RepID=S3VCW0_9LEPT|nr:CbtB domain-containing protein [Leptospira fainei]EPG74340.1 putative cobalt transporter subunit CbtB [Leptospira fainei serovar Hurstbridge str. BUT 6]